MYLLAGTRKRQGERSELLLHGLRLSRPVYDPRKQTMTELQRLRIQWSGFLGAPGVTTLYFVDAAVAQAKVQTFLTAIKTLIPTVVTMRIESSGDIINVQTGALTGAWTGGAQTPTVGTAVGNYSPATGFQARWECPEVINGHRVRGRSYFVPCGPVLYDPTGTIADATVTAVTGFGNTLITSQVGNMAVWVRPHPATPAWTDVRGRTHAATAARDGNFGVPTSCSVPDKVCVLASRRG